MNVRLGPVALVLAGLLSACGPAEKPEASPQPTGTPAGLPSVSHPKAAVPKDRDLARVVSTLTGIDACRLLDPTKAPSLGKATISRTGPHGCEIEGQHALIRAELGAWGDRSKRFGWELGEVRGARIYRQRFDDECTVWMPVSFDYSIRFFSSTKFTRPESACREADAFAAAAVAVLTKAGTPAHVPLAGWSGCAVLSAILGQPVGSLQLGGASSDFVDGCSGRTASLGIWYGTGLKAFKKTLRIGGRTVGVDEYKECSLTWDQGLSGQPAPNDRIRVDITAPTCAAGQQLVKKAQTLLAGPAPKRAPAQYPLYLRADEPDSPRPGACVDLNLDDRTPCQPYVPVDAPNGAAEILRRAKADPNVVCAVSTAAVGRLLGAGLQPVTTRDESCTYVEQTHRLQVVVGIGNQSSLAYQSDLQSPKIAGREAKLKTGATENVLVVDCGQGVFLELDFAFSKGRTGRLDTTRTKDLQPLATEIVSQFF
ncbi:hypothetical protein [Kribbella monticola]|uniref:hypothetical protein n=1 Tax=Kribbella monticola TaxID=2185285 RepID=UPI000DD42FE6|nr:hypothetical protein [Kribbella monticola]